jgi:hypothetical protein
MRFLCNTVRTNHFTSDFVLWEGIEMKIFIYRGYKPLQDNGGGVK